MPKETSREAAFRDRRISHWNGVARDAPHDTIWSSAYHQRMRQVYAALIPAGQRVIEVGCGDGNLLAAVGASIAVGDGNESDVLAGGQTVLARFGPLILFELCPYVLTEHGTTSQALLDALRQHGYAFFELNGWPFTARTEDRIAARVPDGGSVNLIARRPARRESVT